MNNANGSVFKYPDNVDTDVIIPARYLNTQNAKELAAHCMEDIDKDFINKVKEGDIMVGGWNFGCGSSREHAPLAIKTAGISVVIAKSFARIFYRNSALPPRHQRANSPNETAPPQQKLYFFVSDFIKPPSAMIFWMKGGKGSA